MQKRCWLLANDNGSKFKRELENKNLNIFFIKYIQKLKFIFFFFNEKPENVYFKMNF